MHRPTTTNFRQSLRPAWILGILAGLVFAFALQPAIDAGGSKSETSDAKIQAKATASKITADGKQMVSITVDIDKPFYIYANPVRNELLEGARTKIAFKAGQKVLASVKYPPGKEKSEIVEKEKISYYTYTGSVTFQAEVQRTMGDSTPLEISIDVNACHPGTGKGDGYCLRKGTKVIRIP